MRQLQATYVITEATTTALAQDVSASADIIHVNDAAALAAPDPAINQWGVITIDAERIMYREIDYDANTVSSLIRGTAGTAATAHTVEVLANVAITGTSGQFSCSATTDPLVAGQLLIISGTNIGTGSITGYSSPTTYRISETNGSTTFVLRTTTGAAVTTTAGTPFGLTYNRTSAVYNASAGNLLGQQFQNYIVETTTLGDGVINNGIITGTQVFTAPNITLSTSTTVWTDSITYNAGDIVDDSGSFYRAIQNVPVSTDITDTEYWQPLDVAVEVYVGGLRVTRATVWVISNTYSTGDIVVNGGSFYSAKQDVPASTSITNTNYWQPLDTTVEAYAVTAQAPVSVTLNAIPLAGIAVTILVRRGTWVFYA